MANIDSELVARAVLTQTSVVRIFGFLVKALHQAFLPLSASIEA